MWRRFLIIGAFTTALGLLSVQLAILAVDPLEISPIRLWSDKVLTDGNRRFMAPRIIRSGDYDSYIVGTSTLHHVPPETLERVLGGRFANVATHGAMPYEQRRVLDLIFRQPAAPRVIVHGIDASWCTANMPRYHPQVPLPEWLYGESVLDQLAHSLNARLLFLVVRRFLVAVGLSEPALAPSGYHNDLQDAMWAKETVSQRLWAGVDRSTHVPDALVPSPAGAPGQYPEIEALGEILKGRTATKIILVMMPLHDAVLPAAGSDRAVRLSACKGVLRSVALAHGVTLIDYLHPSKLSQNEENFWDHDHTRVGFADRLAADLAISETADSDPGGVWIKLAGPTNHVGQP